MSSRLLRRSGVALYNVATMIGWRPDICYHVGVGVRCEEVAVMREAWPDMEWIGFEPHPEIVAAMRPNYPGLIHQVALSDRRGTASLYAKELHKDGSSLLPHDQQHDNNTYPVFDVELDTLDAMFPLGPKPCWATRLIRPLLWIDTEGSELQVLRGGEQFIAGVEVVNVELTANPPSRGWSDPLDVWDWLVGHGFYAQHIHTQRGSGGQNDVIFVRPELFRPERSCFPPETKRWRQLHETDTRI